MTLFPVYVPHTFNVLKVLQSSSLYPRLDLLGYTALECPFELLAF